MTEEAASILVVDDEQSITDFVSYSLMKEGFKVDVANNGEDALEQATRKHYDLFVLDIMLPGMDGYELCRRLRSRTTAPVLFLAARGTALDRVVGVEIGGPNGPIDLTPREFELLAALMKDAGKVVTREDLLREAWGWEYITETKTVDTHIKRLRDKISQAGFDPSIIETVRGYGYRFKA